jgi:preprotein translocase subunit SecD
MLDFPRWKVWSISLVILIGILFAIPSMLPADLKARYPKWLPNATINLGLDLAGGSQLLLEADQADAAKQRLQAMEDQVATELRRNPRVEIGDVSTAGGRVSFLVRDPTQVDTAVERLRAITQPVAMTGSRDWDVQVMDSTRIVLTPTQSGSQRRSAGHQGNHRHQPGRRPDPRRGSGRRGPRGAEKPDRPDGAPRVQAGRPYGRPQPGGAGPGTGRKPGPADGGRRRQHRREASGHGLRRPAGRR